MNENIDLTKILKNCPKDTIFYSSIYEYVTVRIMLTNKDYPISLYKSSVNGDFFLCRLTKEGKYNNQFNGECTLFPSKEQRDWSKFTAPWYKKEKFDANTLQPYMKVLVRDRHVARWRCAFFSHKINDKELNTYKYATSDNSYVYCIPYNDDTKHLVGTKDEAPEFYRYWED